MHPPVLAVFVPVRHRQQHCRGGVVTVDQLQDLQSSRPHETQVYRKSLPEQVMFRNFLTQSYHKTPHTRKPAQLLLQQDCVVLCWRKGDLTLLQGRQEGQIIHRDGLCFLLHCTMCLHACMAMPAGGLRNATTDALCSFPLTLIGEFSSPRIKIVQHAEQSRRVVLQSLRYIWITPFQLQNNPHTSHHLQLVSSRP